jgi:hypothetical protein
MFIFYLVNFRVVKPQVVGKTIRIEAGFSYRQTAGEQLQNETLQNETDGFRNKSEGPIGIDLLVLNKIENKNRVFK